MLKLEYSATKRKNKMIINSLEQMETIVSKSRSLSWDGWSVIETYPSDKARSSVSGIYLNGKWHMKKIFTPSRKGWEIPSKYVM